jgi:hypothetical protein
MGFRNPVNSLNGSQITPGTITGSSFQTAATGRRVVVSSDPARPQQIEFYTGRPTEVQPGGLAVSVPVPGVPIEYPQLVLQAPVLADTGAGPLASILLRGASTAAGGYDTQLEINAALTAMFGNLNVSGTAKDCHTTAQAWRRAVQVSTTAAASTGTRLLIENFWSLPFATRVVWNLAGTAGSGAAAGNFGVNPWTSPAMVMTGPIRSNVYALACAWAAISESGVIDIPANTQVAFPVDAVVPNVAGYYRVALTWTREWTD